MQKRIILLASFLVLLMTIWGFVGNFFYHQVLHFDTKKNKRGLQYQIENQRFNVSRFDTLQKKDVLVKSDFGYPISALYIDNSTQTDTTVVLAHGLSSHKYMILPYADIFLDMGYNTLLLDHANHGKSGGTEVKYGFAEKYDLASVVEWMLQQNPKTVLIFWGESMGAATTIQYAALKKFEPNSLLYIVDSPYSDLYKMLKFRLKEDFGLPNLALIETMNLFSKLRSDFSIYQVRPIDNVKQIDKPILFIHSQKDNYVPFYMSEEMFSNAPEGSKFWKPENRGHVKTYFSDKEEYVKRVRAFIHQTNQLKLQQ